MNISRPGYHSTQNLNPNDAYFMVYILWINCIICKNKNQTKRIISRLKELQIESKFFWKPMHKQKTIKNKLIIDSNLQFTDFIWDRIVTLPSSPNLKRSVQVRIISEINKIWKKN